MHEEESLDFWRGTMTKSVENIEKTISDHIKTEEATHQEMRDDIKSVRNDVSWLKNKYFLLVGGLVIVSIVLQFLIPVIINFFKSI